MRYLCLAYVDDHVTQHLASLDAPDWAARVRDLRRSGTFAAAELLQPPQPVATVRVRQGRLSAAVGSCSGARQSLAGFMLIDARDLNEAMQVAAQSPLAEIGSIEVRQVADPFEEPVGGTSSPGHTDGPPS